MADEDLHELIYLEANYLQPQFTRAVIEGAAVVSLEMTGAEDVQQNLIYGFMFSLPLVYFLLARPAVGLLDQQLKRTRGLLILVPQEILMNIPNIRQFMAAEFNEQH